MRASITFASTQKAVLVVHAYTSACIHHLLASAQAAVLVYAYASAAFVHMSEMRGAFAVMGRAFSAERAAHNLGQEPRSKQGQKHRGTYSGIPVLSQQTCSSIKNSGNLLPYSSRCSDQTVRCRDPQI